MSEENKEKVALSVLDDIARLKISVKEGIEELQEMLNARLDNIEDAVKQLEEE